MMKSLLLTLVLIASFSATAAEECGVHFQVQPVGNYLRKDIPLPAMQMGSTTAKKTVAASVKKATGQPFSGTTFDEAIDQVYLHLKNRSDLSALEKSNKLAIFNKELNPVFEGMLAKAPAKGSAVSPDLRAWAKRKKILDQVKTAKYQVVRKISDLEKFAFEEFQVVAKNDMVLTRGTNLTQLTHMKMKDYDSYVDSYLHGLKDTNHPNAAVYKNIDEGSLGILTINDIRDITSYSVWPMYYKSHDIKHIHYGLTHPMALASMMGVTRSKNNMRYAIMAGLYEGVDRVQYGHESSLNQFFSSQLKASDIFGVNRNVDLEEAMIMIGNATEEELTKIASKVGVNLDAGLFSGIRDWRPKRIEGTPVNGTALDGETFEQEINDMVAQYSKLLDKSEKIKAKLVETPNLILSDEDVHFMKKMNFQLDPENPEIVIDGLRFKNDGRAHSWGGNQETINIGIGDQ